MNHHKNIRQREMDDDRGSARSDIGYMQPDTMKSRPESLRSKGFALVITLSLMILLTVVAVGLLTLASISLRASTQGEAMATARANARLALMLAIGDLQKSLGPDRAVSASSEILTATPAKPHTTGVWESWWDFDPSGASLDYRTEKSKRFRRWLVSNADPAALESQDFATAKWSGKTIALVDDNAMGGKVAATAKVVAGRVPIARNGKVEGAYAWHVADEAQKARINLYRDPDQNTTVAQQRALLAGQRPDPSVVKGADGNQLTCLPADTDADAFKKATETSAKLTDLDQAELLDQARGQIKPLRHDLTPWSLGVLADVRGGGLKQDLSSVFEMSTATVINLPAEFSGRKLYESTHKITGISDPYWSALAGYYNSFRKITDPEGKTDGPKFAVSAGAATTDPVPKTYNPAPVIAKVDNIFSLIVRPVQDLGWLNSIAHNAGYDYCVDLIYTPVVTLHNPYNVNLSFYRMNVKFLNVPVAFQFRYAKGGTGSLVSQSIVPETFESINIMAGNGSKTFAINIANWQDTQKLSSSSTITGPIVMKPGQTLICGPRFRPDRAWKDDQGGDTDAFDWNNDLKLTEAIKAQPGVIPSLGFETYGVTPGNYIPGRSGVQWSNLFLSATDRFCVEFQAQQPRWDWSANPPTSPKTPAPPSFVVTAELQASSGSTPVEYAKLEFDYQDDTSLQKFFNNQVCRYPPTGSLSASDAPAAPAGVKYSEQGAYVHTFAIFSAAARTTNGGVYFDTHSRTQSTTKQLLDGRLAGKPFLCVPSMGTL